MEQVSEADLITPTPSDWYAPSTLFPKENGAQSLVLHHLGLKMHIEETSWPLSININVIDP